MTNYVGYEKKWNEISIAYKDWKIHEITHVHQPSSPCVGAADTLLGVGDGSRPY